MSNKNDTALAQFLVESFSRSFVCEISFLYSVCLLNGFQWMLTSLQAKFQVLQVVTRPDKTQGIGNGKKLSGNVKPWLKAYKN